MYLMPIIAMGQAANFQQGTKETILLERLEIKYQKDSVLNFSQFRNFNRKWWAKRLQEIKNDTVKNDITPIDRYNIERSLMNNLEWVEGDHSQYLSKKTFIKGLYSTPANLLKYIKPIFRWL